METCVPKNVEERRLWIGNLDPRVTEYHLLKLMQKHGEIEKFDLLFHRNGPLAGQPRGYAFVTYSKREDAINAKTVLNNVLVGQKIIKVTWAHNFTGEEVEKPKPEINIPVLAMAKDEPKTDRESQIQAIEAKLKLMEKRQDDELKINDTVASKVPVILQYQQNKDKVTNVKQKIKRNDRHNNSIPYGRSNKKRR